MNVAFVAMGQRHLFYAFVHEWLVKAEEWTLNRKTVDDLSRAYFSPDTGVWIVVDDNKILHGYLMTEIRSYPQSKRLVVMNCAGNDGKLEACVQDVFRTFEEYAKVSGCDGIEFQGRQAWWKHVKELGYDRPYVQYYKKLGE